MTTHDERDWRRRAACQDTDPEIFHPIGGPTGDAYQAQATYAKKVCRGCPVRDECLEFALDFLEFGVAGGMDQYERARLRRQLGLGKIRPATPTRRQIGAAGRALLHDGAHTAVVARQLGVSPRTAERWQQQVREEAAARAALVEGERAS